MIDQAIYDLIAYAVRTGLIETEDETWCANALLERLKLDSYAPPAKANERPVHEILQELTDDAVARGVLEDDQTLRDLFDTGLMGCLTPRASEVRRTFREKYAEDPKLAKGLVKREVIRIVTPGTNMSQETLDETKNNYLMCISYHNFKYGISVADLSTGVFKTCTISTAEKVIDEMAASIILDTYLTEKNTIVI